MKAAVYSPSAVWSILSRIGAIGQKQTSASGVAVTCLKWAMGCR